jgi:hypothetical protein
VNKLLPYRFFYNNILYLLLFIILLELVLGGGGRYLELNGITARMFLFTFAIIIAFIHLSIKKKINKDLVILSTLYSVILVFHLILGFINNANFNYIIEDIKPLLYFYIIFYFSITIYKKRQIEIVEKIIIYGSSFLAILYLFVVYLIFQGYIDFTEFYKKQYEIGEIFFRGDNLFFYKGFLYLCIGFIFILVSNIKFKFPLLLLLFTSIVLTLTRGFILFTSIVGIFYIFFINKKLILKISSLTLLCVLITVFLKDIVEIFQDRADSDVVRFTQMTQVTDNITPFTILFGHGFGIGVQDRPIHMENSFLEIFHKQGIIGIGFWLFLLAYIFIIYVKIKYNKNIALPFLLSTTFVYLQSFTNPFVNNPIGLSIILLTIVILNKLKNLEILDQ